MSRYRLKQNVEFEAVQWTDQSCFEGVSKFCVNWMVRTPFGMLRVNRGNFVIKGPGNFKIVLDSATFPLIFEKVE